jgi:hypothetical protein
MLGHPEGAPGFALWCWPSTATWVRCRRRVLWLGDGARYPFAAWLEASGTLLVVEPLRPLDAATRWCSIAPT